MILVLKIFEQRSNFNFICIRGPQLALHRTRVKRLPALSYKEVLSALPLKYGTAHMMEEILRK